MQDTNARAETVLLPWFVGWFLGFVLLEGIERQHPDASSSTADTAVLSEAFAANQVRPLDTAAPRELRHLPGIGPTRALAIVRSRWESGPFRALEDLMRVPGIGPGTLEAVRRWRPPPTHGPIAGQLSGQLVSQPGGQVVRGNGGPYTPAFSQRTSNGAAVSASNDAAAAAHDRAALRIHSEPRAPAPASESPAQPRTGDRHVLEPAPHSNDPPRRP